MSSYCQGLPQIPQRLLSLPVQNGYPIPWFVAKVGDSYDFRYADKSKIQPAIKKRLCWICGQKLGSYLAFGVSPMCVVNRTIAEPPSHRDCMEWAIKSCPFLAQRVEERRTTNLPDRIEAPGGFAGKRQPGVVVLWITKTYRPFNAPGGILFKVGDPTETHWFREGRSAILSECIEAVESGYSLLLELARLDGKAGIRELERQKAEAMKFLPHQ